MGKKESNQKNVPIQHGGLKKSGVSSLAMKKYGRNMARVMNQRSTSRGR